MAVKTLADLARDYLAAREKFNVAYAAREDALRALEASRQVALQAEQYYTIAMGDFWAAIEGRPVKEVSGTDLERLAYEAIEAENRK